MSICKCLHLRSFHQYTASGSSIGECQISECPCKQYAIYDRLIRIKSSQSHRRVGRPSEEQLWQEELAEETARDHTVHMDAVHPTPIEETKPTEFEALTVAPVKIVAKFMRKYGDMRIDVMKLKMRGKLKVVSF